MNHDNRRTAFPGGTSGSNSADVNSIDPDPRQTPGLEPGGSVRPGDTPPDTPQTSGLSHQQAPLYKRFPLSGIIGLLAVVVLVVVFAAVAIGLFV